MPDLARSKWIRDVHQSHPLRKPGERYEGAAKRSEGWWQPLIGGCGVPSVSRPGTWNVAIGTGSAPR